MSNVLILLIGSNPLPNYVVAKYLLSEQRTDTKELPKPDQIIMVVSKDTMKFGEIIADKLGLKNSVSLKYANLNNGQRDSSVIESTVKDRLTDIVDISSIHLNYTGGTKPMAVHAYKAVTDYCHEKGISPICSDIDPVNNRLAVDGGISYPTNDDLRKYVKIDIKTILELHDMSITSEGDENYTPSIEKLKGWISKNHDCFDNFFKSFNFDKAYKDKILKKKILDRTNGNNNKDNYLTEKLKIFEEPMIKDDPTTPNGKKYLIKKIEDLHNNGGGKDFIEFKDDNYYIKRTTAQLPALYFLEFLSGKWLEEYILFFLKNNQFGIDMVRKNIEANFKDRKAEFDVIAVKGYNLYFFSCTTDNSIKLVKQKAFEALYRAEQIGGEHAKVVIVSNLPNKADPNNLSTEENNIEQLEKDLSQFDACSKVTLIGRADINFEKNLKDSLIKIFK